MRKILSIAIVALAAACGSEDEEAPIRYGAAQPPTVDEQGAADGAAATLAAILATPTSTEPGAGAATLGDQIAGQLGGGAVALDAPRLGKTGEVAPFQVIDPSTCAAVTYPAAGQTKVTWDHCHFVETSGTTTVTFDVNGSMTFTEATGHTSWAIDQANVMVDSAYGERIAMTSSLAGWTIVTASTIRAETSSTTGMTIADPTMTMSFAFQTDLWADLDYVADPAFCITGGSLRVEQRVAGGPLAPDQGWLFEWIGCGAFTVAHGG